MKSKKIFTCFLATILISSFFVGSVWAMEEDENDLTKQNKELKKQKEEIQQRGL